MTKQVIHVSDAEAANDFASLLDRVREGAEIVIEHNARPVAVVRPAESPRVQPLPDSIARAKAHIKDPAGQPDTNTDAASESLSPQARLANLKATRFPFANQADRVQRSLQVLNQPLDIDLSAEQWAVVAGLSEEDEE